VSYAEQLFEIIVSMRMRLLGSTFAVLAALSCTLLSSSSAEPLHVTNVRVESVLKAWNYPVGQVNGAFDQSTRQAMCAWRDMAGRNVTHSLPSIQERFLIDRAVRPKVPDRLVVGLNVSIACQVVIWVVEDKVTGERQIHKVFQATTGMQDYPTRIGTYHIYAQRNEWQESDLYPGAMMYRPKYFDRGQAFHGSATDALVVPYPASHGCVRMLHSAIKELWTANVGVGTIVKVYGVWS
jgi:L,D-transpeptidase catalytic domain